MAERNSDLIFLRDAASRAASLLCRSTSEFCIYHIVMDCTLAWGCSSIKLTVQDLVWGEIDKKYLLPYGLTTSSAYRSLNQLRKRRIMTVSRKNKNHEYRLEINLKTILRVLYNEYKKCCEDPMDLKIYENWVNVYENLTGVRLYEKRDKISVLERNSG